MALEMLEIEKSQRAVHPENRIEAVPVKPQVEDELLIARPSLCKVLSFAFLSGTVGSVLTLMCLGLPLNGGDLTAALSIWPLVLVLIAVVNGWIAANVFVGSGLPKK
jgi:hypothetical protein